MTKSYWNWKGLLHVTIRFQLKFTVKEVRLQRLRGRTDFLTWILKDGMSNHEERTVQVQCREDKVTEQIDTRGPLGVGTWNVNLPSREREGSR